VTPRRTVTERARCSCGGAIEVASWPPNVVLNIIDLFWQTHSGDGHEPVSQPSAAKAAQ
jgi:hypothetical protein